MEEVVNETVFDMERLPHAEPEVEGETLDVAEGDKETLEVDVMLPDEESVREVVEHADWHPERDDDRDSVLVTLLVRLLETDTVVVSDGLRERVLITVGDSVCVRDVLVQCEEDVDKLSVWLPLTLSEVDVDIDGVRVTVVQSEEDVDKLSVWLPLTLSEDDVDFVGVRVTVVQCEEHADTIERGLSAGRVENEMDKLDVGNDLKEPDDDRLRKAEMIVGVKDTDLDSATLTVSVTVRLGELIALTDAR